MSLTYTFAALTFPAIDPVLIELGPIAIRWYGLSYVIGIVFGWWYAKRLVSNPRLWGEKGSAIKPIDIDDFLTWAVIGIVLGGRLGYTLFYDFEQFAANPLRIVEVWNGGMSFHGGLLGTLVAMIWFARRRGIGMFSLFDVITASAGIGIMCVRIANFINAELYGKPTDVPWGMAFPGGGKLPRHPSQLYEALLEGLILFFLLRFLTHSQLRLKRPGFVAGAFLLWYALSRIAVETVRLPDAHIGYLFGGWFTMGMLLSLPLLLVGIWAMASSQKRALSQA